MKSSKIFIPLLLVFVWQIQIRAQWKLAPTYNTGSNDVYFNDQNWGYQVGNNGYLAKSSDVGLTWQTQITPSKSGFQCVDFPSAITGYVGTYDGEVLKTINGGTNWIELPSTGASDIKSIEFVTDDIGWFCTYTNGSVYRTRDGGVSWESQALPGINFLVDIHFNDAQHGWVVGSNGTASIAYETTNGGISWSLISSINIGGGATHVQFNDENNGWISTLQGTIYRTSDGGQNWLTSTIPASLFVNDLQFIANTNIGYLATSQGLYKTSDSGQTWSLIGFTALGVSNVFFIDEMNGRISRGTGLNYFTSDGGSTWTSVSNEVDYYINIYGITFIDANTGWSVGDVGLIRRSTDGGNTWQIQSSPIATSLYAVDFITSSSGWVVGANGRIAATNTGGVTWSTQTSGTTEVLYSVDFMSLTAGVIVGANGLIIRTSNAGSTWVNTPSGTVNNLRSVHFPNSSVGYIVGSANTILKSIDGGNTWVSISNPAFASTNFLSVFFTDASNGVAVGTNGVIIKTTNGGTTWTQIPTGITDPLLSVNFIDAQEGWAIGYNGAVLHTYDAGNTWYNENLAEFTPQPYNSIATIPGGGAYIVGNNSVEFQYEDNCDPVAPTDYSTLGELSYCSGANASSVLMAGGKGTISWYDAPTGGNFLASGNVFTTPTNLTSSVNYYVQDSTCASSPSRTLIELSVSSTIPTATITQNVADIEAIETDVSYQWIECNSNSFIAGATNQNYTATFDGNFGVIVNLNGCETQSSCVAIGLNIDEQSNKDLVQLYPNPASEKIFIQNSQDELGSLKIYSTMGQMMLELEFTNQLTEIDLKTLSDGLYYIHFETKDAKFSWTFVKN